MKMPRIPARRAVAIHMLLVALSSSAVAECPVNNVNETTEIGTLTDMRLIVARRDFEVDATGALTQQWRLFSPAGQLIATITLEVRDENGAPRAATLRFESGTDGSLKSVIEANFEKVRSDLKNSKENAFAKYFSITKSKSCSAVAKKDHGRLEISAPAKLVLQDIPMKTACSKSGDPLSCVTTGKIYEKDVKCHEIAGIGRVLVLPVGIYSENCTHEFTDELRFLDRASQAGEPDKRPLYTIQVASYPTREEALHRIEQLKSKGFDAFFSEAQLPGKGVWYRLNVGHFQSRKEAEAPLHKLMSDSEFKDALIQQVK